MCIERASAARIAEKPHVSAANYSVMSLCNSRKPVVPQDVGEPPPIQSECLQVDTLPPRNQGCVMKHASHPEIVKRLKQAQGHLATILVMFESGRSCPDLAQQLQAVESTLHKAKRTLIQDHMEHCIGDAVARDGISGEQALREFRALAKYL